jgi:malonyl-ACP decarboxylase
MSTASVVITGMGLVCALGDTLDKVTNALQQGQSGICAVRDRALPIQAAALLSPVDYPKRLQSLGLPSALLDRAQTLSYRASGVVQTAIYSALSAWQQAQLDTGSLDNSRVGVIVAGHNLNSSYSYQHYQRYGEQLAAMPPRYGLQFLDTYVLGTLSELLTIHGPGFTVGGASASGNVGIIQGQQLIASGQVDICVVLGALADLSPLELQAWQHMGAMGGQDVAPEQSCRPFDQAHEGFIYGQGCGCLVLESSFHAQQRGTQALATLAGGAITLDGNRLANPSQTGEQRAMAQALTAAGLTPAAIDYINTHGTSSALGDETELAAIKTVFQQQLRQIWLNATKGLTGHCLYAAGVIEAIVTILQMQQGFVHANPWLENPIDKEFRFVGAKAEQANIRAALSNSFGFGGINTALVLTSSL